MPRARRKKGRPDGGHMKIHPAHIARLPDEGTPAGFARILGISHTTMASWIDREGAPCEDIPGKAVYRRRMLNRSAFVRWMKKAGKVQE